jgi:KTSC domain
VKRSEVTSSNVHSVGYDEPSQTLEVRFHNGGVYQFQGVTPDEHDELMSAPSIGAHLHTRIKGKYRGNKLENAE